MWITCLLSLIIFIQFASLERLQLSGIMKKVMVCFWKEKSEIQVKMRTEL